MTKQWSTGNALDRLELDCQVDDRYEVWAHRRVQQVIHSSHIWQDLEHNGHTSVASRR